MQKLNELINLIEQSDHFLSDVEISSYGVPKSLPKGVYLAHNFKVNLKWHMDEEKRQWGIKSLIPIIPDQSIELVFLEATEDEDIEHTLIWNIKDANTSFDFSDASGSSIQILPKTLEIDFNKNSTEVVFSVT